MGPGGSYLWARPPPVTYTRRQTPLDLTEVGHLVASGAVGLALGGLRTGASLVTGFIHWRVHSAEDSVFHRLQDIVEDSSSETGSKIQVPLIPNTSGGGGPGESLTSTDTPLTVSEQGRALAQAGKYGRTPSASGRKESRASRRRCPSGYRWNGRRCVKR